MLNSGDAKQPVRAISTNPLLAIDVFAIKSPIELPQAKTVSPSNVVGKPVNRPRILRRSIMMFAKSQIQKTLMTKDSDISKPNTPPSYGAFVR